MLTRRHVLGTAGFGIPAAVPILRARPVRAAEIERKQVKIAFGSAAQQVVNLPLNVAITKGYFTQEGLEPEITELGSGARGVQALIGGSVDMVAGAYEHVLRMQARKIDLKSVVTFNRATSIAMGITKAMQPRYKTLQDLKGAKIGITAPGSASQFFLNLILTRAGMKPTDVSTIGIGGSMGAVAAVRTGGELDAVVNYDPLITELEASGDIRIVYDSRTLEGTKALYGDEYMFVCTYTSAEFIRTAPSTVQAVVNAIARALVWMRTASPDEILAAVPEIYRKSNPELYKQTIINNFSGLSRDGRGTPGGAAAVYTNLKEFDPTLAASSIDLATTYDNRFIDAALKTIG